MKKAREFPATGDSMGYSLSINEVFTSINGEVSPCKQGSIATFIRLSCGCNLKCPWCDTKNHTNTSSTIRVLDKESVLRELKTANKGTLSKNITITGGEPLLAYSANKQMFITFLRVLRDCGFNVAIETNGTFGLPSEARPFVRGFVVDYKFFLLDEGWKVDKVFAAGKDLQPCDYVKLVLDKEHHISLAKQFLSYYTSFVDPESHPTFAISIVNEGGNHYLNPSEVIKSFADDGYDVLLNVQIHKFLKIP